MDSTFANRVKEFRQFKRLSQDAMAEHCGLIQGNVAQMEKGTDPKQSNVAKLLAGFPDLSPDWLLFGAGTMLRGNQELTLVKPNSAQADRIKELERELARERAWTEKLWEENQQFRELGKKPASTEAADTKVIQMYPIREIAA
jgi:transcriptional regulator with XRE-family HTH domain